MGFGPEYVAEHTHTHTPPLKEWDWCSRQQRLALLRIAGSGRRGSGRVVWLVCGFSVVYIKLQKAKSKKQKAKKKEKSSLWQIFGLWSLDFGRLCFCLGEIFRRESEREAGVGGRSGGRRRLTAAFGIWYLRS